MTVVGGEGRREPPLLFKAYGLMHAFQYFYAYLNSNAESS